MLIYLLFFILTGLLVECYFYFKKDILQPAILFLLAFSFSVFCALFNIEKWNINLVPTAFWILLGGALEFVFVSIIVHWTFNKKNREDNKKKELIKIEESSRKKLNIFVILFIIYDFIVLGLLLFNIIKISSKYGNFSGISEMLTIFKEVTSYSTLDRLPKYITILLKPFIASVYIFYYLYIKNIIAKEFLNKKVAIKYILKKSYYLIPTLLYMISTFMQSNREAIIVIILNFFVMTILFWYKKNNWNRIIKPIFMLKTFIICILGLVIFFFSAKWVGRINEQGMLDYITFYCGGSIECFNQYVQQPTEISLVRGEETFYNLINALDSFKITNFDLKSKMTVHKEFRNYEGKMIGNVYTGYRRWLHDYGIIGVIILQFIFATIINVLYCSIKFTKNKKIINDFLIIIYSYLSYTIYLQPIDDYFYFDVIGQASFAVLACLAIMFFIVEKINGKVDFKIKKGKNEKVNY